MAGKGFKNTITNAASRSTLSSLIPTGDDQPRAAAKRKAPGKKAGRPERTDKDNKTASAAEKGTKPGEMRKTYLVSIDLAEKMDAIAYWSRLSVKEVMLQAMFHYVSMYEKKNGPVKPVKK